MGNFGAGVGSVEGDAGVEARKPRVAGGDHGERTLGSAGMSIHDGVGEPAGEIG